MLFSKMCGCAQAPLFRRAARQGRVACGELYPRVGFIVTNLTRPAERVVAFYNKHGSCEQWIKEG